MNLLFFKKLITGFLISFFIAIPTSGYAVCQLQFEWDTNNPPVPDGYRLFVREDGVQSYGTSVWDDTGTTATVNDFEEGKTYRSVIRAYIGELESKNSNEIRYTVESDCSVTVLNFPWALFVPPKVH